MSKGIQLELPEKNMSNRKAKKVGSKTHQLCVIPNTKENREALRHINKLAKEQNSHYKIKSRYRRPKKGKATSWGDAKMEDSNGIGIYIEGASAEEWVHELYAENREKDKEMDRLKVDGMDAHTIHNKYIDALKENLRLTDELSDLKNELATKSAIGIFESACREYKNEIGEDDVHAEMCKMVEGFYKSYDK